MPPSLDMTPNVDSPVMALRNLFCLALLLTVAATAQAEERDNEAYRWLERMWQAVYQLNYEGTFVYLHDNHMESLHLVHSAADGEQRERLRSLNGVSREVVRDNHSIICVLPDSRSVSAELRSGGLSGGEQAAFDPEQLSVNYDFFLQGKGRIAGRSAKIVVVVPRDDYRYGHRLFLDEESALPLKTELLDSAGEPVSQVMFTSLRINPGIEIGAEDEQPALGQDHYSWVYQKPARRMQESGNEAADWLFPKLPKGFRLSVHAKRSADNRRQEIDHFVFTDGLATFSVYVEQGGANNGLIGESRMGAINVYGAQHNEYHITAVGEVPLQTVRELAQSVVQRAEAPLQ
jgi:sigma-E factor negative regulatory protein RseB